MEQEKPFANKVTYKSSIYKIHISNKATTKEQTTQLRNGQKILIDISPKKTYRSTEQDRDHRNKPTYLRSISLDKGDENIKWEKVFSAMVLEKLDSCM